MSIAPSKVATVNY